MILSRIAIKLYFRQNKLQYVKTRYSLNGSRTSLLESKKCWILGWLPITKNSTTQGTDKSVIPWNSPLFEIYIFCVVQKLLIWSAKSLLYYFVNLIIARLFVSIWLETADYESLYIDTSERFWCKDVFDDYINLWWKTRWVNNSIHSYV